MGKLILCAGEVAKEPFHFKVTETNVYSIEELCYYIYNNIYIITEDIFDETLVKWLENQVKMEEIAAKLKTMIDNHNSLKDIVVSILCSADYYSEEEIHKLIEIIDNINNLIPIARSKIKADNLLKYRNFALAQREYENILNQKEAGEFTTEEYGNILHNLATALVYTSSFKEAAVKFKEAYSRNNNRESLKQYFMALKMAKCEDEYLSELIHFEVSSESACKFIGEWNYLLADASNLPDLITIQKLSSMKNEGKVNEYYQKIDELIAKWKQTYRAEVGC